MISDSDSLDKEFLRALTLLYVEDDSVVLEHGAEFLRHLVGTVITAASGEEGLAKFRERSVDVVVTDILMPGMNGLTMVEEIRKTKSRVPVIVTYR